MLAFLALLTVAFAGCTSGGNDDPSASTSSSTSSTSRSSSTTSSGSGTTTSSQTTTSGAPAGNHAPTATLSATPVNGSAPLTVNFTATGADADGDSLTWTLVFGDGNQTNGTTLPANATHAYAATGNFTAVLLVTDGKESSNKSIVITVEDGISGATGPQVVNGEWQFGSPVSCLEALGGAFEDYPPVNPLEGIEMVRFDVQASTLGMPFTLAAESAGGAYGIFELTYYDADGAVTDYFSDDGAGGVAGDVPGGSSFAVFWPCLAGPGSFVYTAG